MFFYSNPIEGYIALAIINDNWCTGPNAGGVSYTRWGRTACPSTEQTELLYHGTTTGSQVNQPGSTEYLCLHSQPQFLHTTARQQTWRGKLYGTVYDAGAVQTAFQSIHNHNVPCSVCYTANQNTVITIPGRILCPASWTRQYYGYLMGASQNYEAKSRTPICVDVDSESISGSAVTTANTARFYFYEATCSGINCPPYSDGAEVTCVVCTK